MFEGEAPRADRRVVVIGAGVAGLAAAIDLARQGCAVTLLERAPSVGGKLREVSVGGAPIDAGPTVFTMRWVFERLFSDAGARLDDHLSLTPLDVLARHRWADDPSAAPFDLFADLDASADAVGRLSGVAEARRFRAFCAQARRIYERLEGPFIDAQRAGPIELISRLGLGTTVELTRIAPLGSLWRALGRRFRDPRLRQLFARYATYCGSSPFQAPGVLMLVAHVERCGVWRVAGGMRRIVDALAALASRLGVETRVEAEVSEITVTGGRASGVRLASGDVIRADAVISAVDPNALAAALFGPEAARAVAPPRPDRRSLSAVVWTVEANVRGPALSHHTVCFPPDYAAEFKDIFHHRRLPRDPTVYICAQDRDGSDLGPKRTGAERLQLLVNAPPDGDAPSAVAPGGPLSEPEIDRCETQMRALLTRCGLTLEIARSARNAPPGFHRLFPATGGALYGPANHGPLATFARPGGRTTLPGLYLAGGGVHPGPGVPMATLSGRRAAELTISDFASEPRLRPAAISGGMSTA